MGRVGSFAVGLCLVIGIFASSVSAQLTRDEDFNRRCMSKGVKTCFNFDSQVQIKKYLEPAWDGVYRGHVDTKVKASGAGSLRFTVPSKCPDNSSGSFAFNFSDDFSLQFGQGEQFFVQWRQRFSPSLLDTNYEGDGFKQIIIGEGDRRNYWAPGCSELEVVLYNCYFRGFPQAYHSCERWVDLVERFRKRDFKLQNAIEYPYCLYSHNPSYQVQGNRPCFIYKSNQWMTFQVRIRIGHWNVPDSLVEMWGAEEGQPSVRFLRLTNVTLYQTDPTDRPKYGKVHLTPYMSSKDPEVKHPTAYTWYDELIISKSRIPDPKVP